MDFIQFIIYFILNIDVHLAELIAQYGIWVYAILFLIIFCETGLVVTPFLPGDSLLFVAGALGSLPTNNINVHIMALERNYSVTGTPKYSNKAIWKRHTASMRSTEEKQLS